MYYTNKQTSFVLYSILVREVSLTHTRLYNSLKEKPKKKENKVTFLSSVKGDSVNVDGCALLKYEVGSEKQEHEFFVLPEMNRNIILGRDWLKQLAVSMYYDLGCIRIGKSYVKTGRRHTHLFIS